MFFVPVLMAIACYQEIVFERMLEGYNKPAKETKEKNEIPKGYYACVDCGLVCKRLNASQKRCAICQEIYRRNRKRKKK